VGKTLKRVIIFVGTGAVLISVVLIIFILKPHKVTVEGIPDEFVEKQVNIGEVTLNYVEGPDNGLPLLLIPGQIEFWQGYKLVMPDLAKFFHLYVVDVRGHGKSSYTPGNYSYNVVGNDLSVFLDEVIGEPSVVSGLSSGGVLAIWLGANKPESVLAAIAEDPPIFSSIWPRIQDEKFMTRNFKLAVDILGEPGERDVEGYLSEVGAPVEGKPEILKIPSFIIKGMFFLARINQVVRPSYPYDVPFLPYNIRAGYKFLSEYDTDFSRATIDGDLSKDFSPEETLRKVKCPMLLMRADAYRHEAWGLIGAIDDQDLERIVSLVDNLKTVQVKGGHEIHLVQPQRYVDEVTKFVDGL